jgi:hypothetical protein
LEGFNVKVFRFSHPNWDMKLLVTEAEGGKAVAQDMMSEDEDPALLVIEEIEMTQEEIDNLPEWDG